MAKLCQFVNPRCLKVITMSVSVHSYFTSVIAKIPAALQPPFVRVSTHTYPGCKGILEIFHFFYLRSSDVFHNSSIVLKIPLFVRQRVIAFDMPGGCSRNRGFQLATPSPLAKEYNFLLNQNINLFLVTFTYTVCNVNPQDVFKLGARDDRALTDLHSSLRIHTHLYTFFLSLSHSYSFLLILTHSFVFNPSHLYSFFLTVTHPYSFLITFTHF